jgi:hypothetical protein
VVLDVAVMPSFFFFGVLGTKPPSRAKAEGPFRAVQYIKTGCSPRLNTGDQLAYIKTLSARTRQIEKTPLQIFYSW